jgi:hypothetical protein
MSEETVSPFVRDFFKRVEGEIVSTIVSATVPFYAVQNDAIVRDRSGVLLRVGDDHFILTASHDLKAIVDNNIYLYVGWCEEDLAPVPIPDAVFHTSDEESLDVAIIKLSTDSAKKILSSSKPISLRSVARECSDEKAFYLVSGYPKEWLSVLPDRIESPPLNYFCRIYEGDALPLDRFKYDPKLHLLLEFNRHGKKVTSTDDTPIPPKSGIRGISGCGVWRIVGYSPNAMRDWKPEQVSLVGIEHRYWEKQGAVATTRIQHVLAFLAGGFPNVLPAMNLVYP